MASRQQLGPASMIFKHWSGKPYSCEFHPSMLFKPLDLGVHSSTSFLKDLSQWAPLKLHWFRCDVSPCGAELGCPLYLYGKILMKLWNKTLYFFIYNLLTFLIWGYSWQLLKSYVLYIFFWLLQQSWMKLSTWDSLEGGYHQPQRRHAKVVKGCFSECNSHTMDRNHLKLILGQDNAC